MVDFSKKNFFNLNFKMRPRKHPGAHSFAKEFGALRYGLCDCSLIQLFNQIVVKFKLIFLVNTFNHQYKICSCLDLPNSKFFCFFQQNQDRNQLLNLGFSGILQLSVIAFDNTICKDGNLELFGFFNLRACIS